MKRLLLKLVRDEKGQDLIEYALMVGFVAVAAGAIMPSVSANIKYLFDKIGCGMDGNPSCADIKRVVVEGDNMTRIVCAALAALFLGVLVLRRRNQEV